jgi:ferric-dicitrate binding protein FerR (iron transport regulator)
MLDQCKDAYEAWRAAEAEARHMEGKLTQAWEQFSARKAGAPDQELLTAVSRLRAQANDKLTVALLAISAAREPLTSSPLPASATAISAAGESH